MPREPNLSNTLNTILKRADACYARKDWAMARELVEVALELAPTNEQLLNALGSLQYSQKDYSAALANFEKATRLNPKNPDLQIQLAMTHLGLGDFAEAEAALRNALRLRPGDPLAGKLIGDMVDLQKRWLEEEHAKNEVKFNFTLKKAIERGIATVGRWSCGSPTVKWWGEKAALTIGSFCSIAQGVTIILGGEHNPKQITTFPFASPLYRKIFTFPEINAGSFTKGDVTIGNDVWLGTGVTIMSGANIGHGAVVGAGAVVTKSVPPYTIAGGVPAKTIKRRFSEAQIAQLIDARWWDLSDCEIGKLCPLLHGSDIEQLIAAVADLRRSG